MNIDPKNIPSGTIETESQYIVTSRKLDRLYRVSKSLLKEELGITALEASTDVNFGNTDITFTGNRSHNTDGNTYEFTTDGGGYAESWNWMGTAASTSRAELGYANTWHRYTGTELHSYVANDEITSIKADGTYNHLTTAGAPGAADTNTYVQYAADIAPGQTAPHFMLEDSSIVKLYPEAAVTTTQGIADALEAQGLLATSVVVDGGWTYTEVAVTAAEIKACYSSPKTILAAPGAGDYLDIDRITVEYTHVSTAYTYSPTDVFGLWYYDGSSTYTYTYALNPNFIRATGNKVSKFSGEVVETYASDGGTTGYAQYYGLNEALVLSSYTADPTLGDGTMLIKIWHQTRTAGTE